jgi:hypothetical protein
LPFRRQATAFPSKTRKLFKNANLHALLGVVKDIRALLEAQDAEFLEVIENIHRLEERMEGRAQRSH